MEKTRSTLNLSAETKEKFDMIQEQLGTNQTQTLEKIINAYLSSPELSNEEKAELTKAAKNSKLTEAEIIKKGLLTEARKINALAKKGNLEDMDLANKRANRFKGVAEERIRREIELIMNHNDNQSEPQARLCLTKTLIAKRTGSNWNAIDDFFNKYKTMIEDHNIKHTLKPDHNRNSNGEELLASQG